jgi:hypothetical protein
MVLWKGRMMEDDNSGVQASLREQVRAMLGLMLSQQLRSYDDQFHDLSEEDGFQSELIVELQFVPSEAFGGYIKRVDEKRFALRLSDDFIDRVCVLFASLLVPVENLSDHVTDLKEARCRLSWNAVAL